MTASTAVHRSAPELARIRFDTSVGADFHRTLRARVDAYFQSLGGDRYADASVLAKALALVALACAAYALMLAATPLAVHVVAWVVFGQIILLLAMTVSHDAAHHALTGNRRLDDAVHTIIFSLLGANAYLWQMRHVHSHHTFPNVNGCDIDIDENFFVRLSPNHPRRPHHRFQHLYAPLLYLLVHLHTVLYQDLVYLTKRRLANMTDIRHQRWRYVEFVVAKIAYAGVVLLIPMAAGVPWTHAVIGFLAMSAGISLLFVGLLIGTHFCEETIFPDPGRDGVVGHNWAIHAMVTSVDWNPDSRLANVLVGGFNAHAAHHLFPTVSHIHYVAISKIIEATAAEFAVRYNKLGLLALMASHVRFLRRMAAA